ncbi:MAG TPA: hypothetical protein PKM88_00855, partial [bacterium]|nr:hypothetical protein [bacterium]
MTGLGGGMVARYLALAVLLVGFGWWLGTRPPASPPAAADPATDTAAASARMTARLQRAEQALAGSDYRQAKQLCDAVLAEDAEAAPAYYLLGRIWEAQCCWEEAFGAYQRALVCDVRLTAASTALLRVQQRLYGNAEQNVPSWTVPSPPIPPAAPDAAGTADTATAT